jgi:uracil-DNA glycosylase
VKRWPAPRRPALPDEGAHARSIPELRKAAEGCRRCPQWRHATQGATAARSLLDKVIPITRMRGQVIQRDDGLRVFLTIHPSFILRIREPTDKNAERQRFLADMLAAKHWSSTHQPCNGN